MFGTFWSSSSEVNGDSFALVTFDLREPNVVSSDEIANAIRSGEIIWKIPSLPVDTSIERGLSFYPSKMTFTKKYRAHHHWTSWESLISKARVHGR